jgi:hypothetical protein
MLAALRFSSRPLKALAESSMPQGFTNTHSVGMALFYFPSSVNVIQGIKTTEKCFSKPNTKSSTPVISNKSHANYHPPNLDG